MPRDELSICPSQGPLLLESLQTTLYPVTSFDSQIPSIRISGLVPFQILASAANIPAAPLRAKIFTRANKLLPISGCPYGVIYEKEKGRDDDE